MSEIILHLVMGVQQRVWMLTLKVCRTEEQRKDLLDRITELEERLSKARTESARARLEGEEAKRSLVKVTTQLEKLQEDTSRSHKILRKQLR